MITASTTNPTITNKQQNSNTFYINEFIYCKKMKCFIMKWRYFTPRQLSLWEDCIFSDMTGKILTVGMAMAMFNVSHWLANIVCIPRSPKRLMWGTWERRKASLLVQRFFLCVNNIKFCEMMWRTWGRWKASLLVLQIFLYPSIFLLSLNNNT
jgi:hypothetical protein